MRHNVALATGIAAGVTAIALVATPALAQAGPWSGTRSNSSTTCPMLNEASPTASNGMGRVAGQGQTIGRGAGTRSGMGMAPTSTAPSGALTADQKALLAGMADEEKLAQDLYAVLATTYPNVVQFSRITRSESMHLSAIRTLLSRYGITDPTAGLAAGDFASAATQALYSRLLASATSDASALAAGVAVEKDDIAALNTAKAGVTAPDVLQTYSRLLAASERHIKAFGG